MGFFQDQNRVDGGKICPQVGEKDVPGEEEEQRGIQGSVLTSRSCVGTRLGQCEVESYHRPRPDVFDH
jgi:hypothetical protein